MSSERDDGSAGTAAETAAEAADGNQTSAPEADDLESGPGEDASGATGGDVADDGEELEELRDRHLRLAAEFDNYRKRTRRQLVEQRERAQGDLIRELLEILDDLSRVTEAAPDATSAAALREGVELVSRKFRKTLRDAGLSRVEAEGEIFDPNVHEALTSVPTDDPDQDDRVAEVLTEGYRLDDRLLRPARVTVYQYDGGGSGSDSGGGFGGDSGGGFGGDSGEGEPAPETAAGRSERGEDDDARD